MVSIIDKTESMLIKKFFGYDTKNINIKNVFNNPEDKIYRYLGESNFKNIVSFYRFEFKPQEKEFWDIMDSLVDELQDKSMSLFMSIVDVEYLWLDFVTDIKINYKVINNNLIITYDTPESQYDKILYLICHRIFITDFTNDSKYKATSTLIAQKQLQDLLC